MALYSAKGPAGLNDLVVAFQSLANFGGVALDSRDSVRKKAAVYREHNVLWKDQLKSRRPRWNIGILKCLERSDQSGTPEKP